MLCHAPGRFWGTAALTNTAQSHQLVQSIVRFARSHRLVSGGLTCSSYPPVVRSTGQRAAACKVKCQFRATFFTERKELCGLEIPGSMGRAARAGSCPLAGWMLATPVAAQDTPEPAAGAVAAANIQPETCVTCHSGASDNHQAFYDSLYQDGVIQISDLAYAYTAPDTTVVTFQATKNGAPFNAGKATSSISTLRRMPTAALPSIRL